MENYRIENYRNETIGLFGLHEMKTIGMKHQKQRSLGSKWIFLFLRFVYKQFPFLWNGREASFVPNDISRFLSSGIASSKIPVTFLQSKRGLIGVARKPTLH